MTACLDPAERKRGVVPKMLSVWYCRYSRHYRYSGYYSILKTLRHSRYQDTQDTEEPFEDNPQYIGGYNTPMWERLTQWTRDWWCVLWFWTNGSIWRDGQVVRFCDNTVLLAFALWGSAQRQARWKRGINNTKTRFIITLMEKIV